VRVRQGWKGTQIGILAKREGIKTVRNDMRDATFGNAVSSTNAILSTA